TNSILLSNTEETHPIEYPQESNFSCDNLQVATNDSFAEFDNFHDFPVENTTSQDLNYS
ncbi:15998_t:CDS:1, partial [Funneliformis mosseae]